MVAMAGPWEDYLAQKTALVSHTDHLPFRLSHGNKTATSVLLIHGAYSSPLHFRAMAQSFHQAGHNVLTILLPGHWEKDLRSLDRTTHEHWVSEVDTAYQLARDMGEKVIIAGHSLGGLLAVEQASKRPANEVSALVLFSPAVRLWPAIVLASRAGHAMGLSGNDVSFSTPDGKRVPYFSTRVASEIAALAQRVRTHELTLPVFVAYTWNDNLVSVPTLRNWSQQKLQGPTKIQTFSIGSGVNHANISTSSRDIPSYGHKHNPYFNSMMQKALDFLAR